MVMNQKQKKLSKIISVIIGLIVVFPPYVIRLYQGNVVENGFSFIFDLPSRATVNVSMLFAEMIGALIIGVILFYASKENNE